MVAQTAPRFSATVQALQARFGERVSTSPAVREHHGKDESYFPYAPPDAVVFVQSTAEVSEIVRLCARHKTPVIAYGTGTSLEGHILAINGGICVDLSGMNKILRVNPEDLDATVEAGVTRKTLNNYIKDTGLFFPIDPGADASLGGMASTRASGTNAVRYGTMRENVLGLTVVLADGRVIRTARRAKKSAAGYDLTRLFVGSEGTLGVITEVTLRLYGIPEQISSAVCAFPSVKAAVDTVISIIQSGIPIARVELLGAGLMDAVNKFSKLDHTVAPTLMFEFHGTKNYVAEQVEAVEALAKDQGGANFRWAHTMEERNKLWQARHDAYFASLQTRPGARAVSTDVCVPISRLAECIVATEKDMAAASMPIHILGHVGDGNFHLIMLIDPNNPKELDESHAINERLVHRALALDGTCTGEHGVGIGKLDFLVAEMGDAISVMRAIKKTLDPDNIMNPGKILRMN